MDVAAHYRNLLSHSETVLNEILGDDEALAALTVSHNYLLDYDRLKSAIVHRPEVAVLNAAVKEYQFALFALVCGQYRHAFGGLRLFFELMLVTVQFSAHEIDYWMWEKGAKDVNWNALINLETGIFSKNFVKAFNQELSDDARQYVVIAEKVYRECSEFVHGNANTHSALPSGITYDKELLISWYQKAESMRMVIVFAFSARYLGHIEAEGMNSLEQTVLEVIGHLPSIRSFFGATT